MPTLSPRDAVRLYRVSRATLMKALSDGTLSAAKTDAGHWQIEPAELARVYLPRAPQQAVSRARPGQVNRNEPDYKPASEAADMAARLAQTLLPEPSTVRGIRRAEMRLADEYDAGQERGEVAGHGRSKVETDNLTTAADLGIRRAEMRLADEYDAGQERGEVAKQGPHVAGENMMATADLGIRRDEMRLADEYDAAQDRGEVAGRGGDRKTIVGKENNDPTSADLGIRRAEIHEARKTAEF